MLETRYFFMNEFTDFVEKMKEFPHTVITFKKGDYLKKASEKFDYNYLILDGLARVSVLHDSGSERVIGYWGNGSMYPIITKKQEFTLEYSIMVKALSMTTALRFDLHSTKAFMKKYPEISYEMINHYCKFGNLFFYSVTTQTYEPLRTRVCSIIMIYYQNFKKFDLPISQNELSSLIGAKRESVVKIIRELKEENLIDTSNGHIHIINPEALFQNTSSFVETPKK